MLCRPGTHYVKKHVRTSMKGKKHVVAAHCRINPKKKQFTLFASNLKYLLGHNKKKFKKLKRIKGHRDNGQYDEIIQFWLYYWKSEKIINFEIDPMIIKSIIAVESSFRERVVTKIPGSTATGVMQVTTTTMSLLAGKSDKKGYVEINKNKVEISQEEAKIAIVNIAAGTRWLIYKIYTSPRRRSKNKKERLEGGIKYYYGWSEDGQKYLEKVLKIYEKNK